MKMISKLLQLILPKQCFNKVYLYRHVYKLITREGSYLVETGYVNSVLRLEPVNKLNQPIPWMNYSFLDFLEPRLNNSMTVFEYGAGYSTYYLADKVKGVTSIEYDKEWLDKVKNELKNKNNCEVLYYQLGDGYHTAIEDQKGKVFDLIIVDGRERVKCAKNALPFLSEKGVLLLDDSWRETYKEVFIFYAKKGYKEISFSGIKPGGLLTEQTTVFYKEGNVLGI